MDVEPDAAQWALLAALLESHPQAIRVDELRLADQRLDVEETIARLLIDGLVIRFGDWLKASDPAARYDQLARTTGVTNGDEVA